MTMTFLANGYSVKYIPIDYAQARRRVEVPLVKDTHALRHAGRAHDPLVQPAADLHAGRARARSSLGFGKLIYDIIEYDFRVTTNTLLILFAAFQVSRSACSPTSSAG